ncbi:chromosome segregation protein SMC [Chitinispirillum alkaliphilum]|nr:chromosome segregation protein SMC [Chitinispirillum alkaliphilum]
MILRKLSIFGFKSFADKTDLRFGSGMTAVIGPNGCGKSNVVDAIRWVFGEQKASMLRSSSMQDVIFSGTQRRQPLNMAEVTLTVENNKGILPVEYNEVSITRRIYRSGESEYRLNKVPCRLRDIHNLFLDTGVGSAAYTTIENSMINAILSDKADERRVLFEEAAGIGKYKQRRKESARQLERTRQDLLRINDKVQEADRQVRMLARHVEKARRYKSYYDNLKSLEVGFENSRYTALAQAMKQRKAFLAEKESLRETLKARIAAGESRIEKMKLAALEKENELGLATRNVSECDEKIINLDRFISVNEERMNNLHKNIAIYEQDAQSLDTQIEEAIKLRTQIEKGIVERESQLQKSKERVDGANDELAAFDKNLSSRRELADQLGRDQIEMINIQGETRNKLSAAKSNLSNSLERKDRDEREVMNLENRLEEYQESIEVCKRQLAEVDETNRNHLQAREVLAGRIEKEDERYRALVESEKHLEAQIASCKSQLKFLAGLDASFEGYESGVKAILNHKPAGLRGIVADLIKIEDEKVVSLVEKVLGNRIQTIVFDTDAQLEAAVEYLGKEKVGSACMISLERLGSLEKNSPVENDEGLVKVASFVKTEEDCSVLADYLFGSMFISPDYPTALQFTKNCKTNGVAVTEQGVICSFDGTVVAGDAKEENAGILQRKQQIEKLSEDVVVFEKDYGKVLTDKDVCVINRDEAKMALVEVDELINRGHRKQQEQQTNISHYENEIQNIVSRIDVLQPELTDLKRKIVELEEIISNGEAEEATFQNRRESLEEQVNEARSALRLMEEERRTLVEHLKNIELEVHGLNNRLAQDKRDIERLTRDNKLFGERKAAKNEEKVRAQREIEDLQNRLVSEKQELEKHKEKRKELEQIKDSVRESYNCSLNEIEQSRKELREDQTEVERISNLVHDSEIKQTRDEQEQRRIREKIWEAYEIDLESPPEDMPVIEEEDSNVVKNISMLKERIKHVGQVNMAALEDYETESQRLKELTEQRDDLQTAVDDLEKAIKKLDKEARTQFLETFELVQKYFTEMFTTLFEGGEANIQLEENVDPLEAAININVRPAGKKMRGVQLLSGGERALTAISLLFALYLVKPSAYCILDELDAPLDDANIGRFVKVLRKFAEKTQFIVITHNKRTMEAADLLYGVTQQESGISTIVSVKFDEAELQAA